MKELRHFMRDIKFRAWDKQNKRYEYDIQDADLSETERSMERFGDYFPSEFNGKLYDDFDIEQYTGLKDKNGKEIYEGDIIKIHTHYIFYGTDVDDWDDEYALVEWSEEYGGFFIYGETPLWEVLFEGRPKDGFYHNYPEVVGNVHENPELLEDE